MDITSFQNQFLIFLGVLRRVGQKVLKILSDISPSGWSVIVTVLIGAVICLMLYSCNKKRVAARGILVIVCTILLILFVLWLLSAFRSAGITDVGLFVVIWVSRRPAAFFNSEGKRIGGAYIRHGQADISRAKCKAETVTVVIGKEYARRHIGETIRFIAAGQTTFSVTIPPATGGLRTQM